MFRKRIFILIHITSFILVCVPFLSCKNRLAEGMLIITEIPGKDHPLPDLISGDSWRYMPEARIVAVNPDKPDKIIILTEDFYAACSPEISWDCKYMFFAGQLKQNESWQIWEMDMANSKIRRITSFKENCTDPAFLPTGEVVFSKYTINDTVKTGHTLFSCNSDGTGLRQLTFHPHATFATTVLLDGRLLAVTRQLFPCQADPMLMVMRPDGTKADLFYKGAEGTSLLSRCRETTEGKIYFIETDSTNNRRGNVVSVNYNRPLHTYINYTSQITGNFNAVLPLSSGRLLVSYRQSESEPFALYEFDPEKRKLDRIVYKDSEFSVADIVQAEKRIRPKKLPSEVDMGVKTGLLLCQDINFNNEQISVNAPAFLKAHKIEVIGIDTTYGILHVEKDGSFQLKVMADIPFQIRTLDKKGQIVNGPCAWMWLRPNERRGCVGCHENPELAPENNVPLAAKKPPVIIPVHISEIDEKEVELE
jgi:hypothetical protein